MRQKAIGLSAKLYLSLLGTLLVSFGLLGMFNARTHRKHLEEAVITSADRISDVIKRSTRSFMLRNDRNAVHEIICTIGGEPGIDRIRIFNDEGRIRFSTDPTEMDHMVDRAAEACTACHREKQPLVRLARPDRVRIFSAPEGHRVLGLINPIENEPDCSSGPCHAHAPDVKVLGVLDVQMSLARVDGRIAEGGRELAFGLALATGVILLISGLFLWTMVRRPVRRLIAGTRRVAGGDLDHALTVRSGDELGQLGSSFNHMTRELREARREITGWAETLERRLLEKTRDLERAHELMVQAEKLGSLGRLAAIVAHEINNPLSGIRTYANLLRRKLARGGADPEEIRESLGLIEGESARCGEIVKGLLQFSRASPPDLKPADLNDLVRSALRLVRHQIDLQQIETALDLAEDLPPLVCDPQQIRQALVVLLINACEAMPQGGRLEIATARDAEPEHLRISVRDNGLGMDEASRRRLFEPFFTTKEKGVGLGLAVLYGIVRRHGGRVEVESAPGEGASFRLVLPEKRAPEEPASLVAGSLESIPGEMGRVGT